MLREGVLGSQGEKDNDLWTVKGDGRGWKKSEGRGQDMAEKEESELRGSRRLWKALEVKTLYSTTTAGSGWTRTFLRHQSIGYSISCSPLPPLSVLSLIIATCLACILCPQVAMSKVLGSTGSCWILQDSLH